MSVKCVCPECRMSISAPTGVASVTCPICDAAVPVPGAVQAQPLVRVVAPPPPPTAPVRRNAPPPPVAAVAPPARRWWVLGLGGALALLWLGGAGAAALYFLHDGKPASAPLAKAPPSPQVVVVESQVFDPRPPPPPPPPPPLPPEQQKKVDAAIARGVVYLKAELKTAVMEINPNLGSGAAYLRSSIGVLSLMGLTLLECGVAPEDADLKKAAEIVRAAVPQLTHTYTIAATLWFLDRLGDKQDAEAVRSLALRLMAGQLPTGGWTYSCAVLTVEEEKNLSDFLKDGRAPPGRVGTLPVVLGPAKQQSIRGNYIVDGDNSNAQFAVLALWVARRQGINVRPSLELIERFFRKSQLPSGGWLYGVGNGVYFQGSMTCAGLLTLAVVRSDNVKAREEGKPAKDAAIENGFRFLSGYIGRGAPANELHQGGTFILASAWGDLYFLWSLERTAMVYDLKMIGGQDWYAWASKAIVGAQKGDGSWRDAFPGRCDTCFALLVLKRANIVQDLTSEVKKAINLKDIAGTRD